ncbi:MAG TPA: hypothetical protein VGS19_30985 [Streptosporangiaceae bacterium]|nr:hypothetical protein [Streptosporangiaceae bacterium]
MGSFFRWANTRVRGVPPFRAVRSRSLIVVAGVPAALAGLLAFASPGSSSASAVQAASAANSGTSSGVANAYTFLNMMMDKYATGTTTRLVQSYNGGGVGNLTDSFTYDDALIVDAYLNEGTPDGLTRAETIGNAFLYLQAHDPAADGRIRAAYAPHPLTSPSQISITDKTSDVGNMTWMAMALCELYNKTGNTAYLTGAEGIANWVVKNTHDTRGAGGYTGGDNPNGSKITWKSTEHNTDAYAMFSMLASETGNSAWTADANWAKQFVASMWIPSLGRFYVGTGTDGVTPNNSEKSEDINSWTYLAFQNSAWAASLTWNINNLSVSVGGFSGESFCKGAKGGVWFEGTGHMADALQFRNASGDAALAAQYLTDIQHAQTNGLNNDGLGIIAASINGLSDCDGGQYFASLHTGATSWYIMASLKVNPFVLF